MRDLSRRESLALFGSAMLPTTGGSDLGALVGDRPDATATAQETTLTLGMSTPPNTLNILRTGTTYEFAILDAIYDSGVQIHPETGEFIPWAFETGTLSPENVGTSDPTIVARLRDGLTFHDGTSLTGEDVQFTVEYIKEQQPPGSISANQFDAVERVTTSGNTVNYFLSERESAWATDILGVPILPKHIWSNVDDFSDYVPRNEGGPIGSGMFVLENVVWPDQFTLSARTDSYPIPEAADYLPDDGPFIDTLNIVVVSSPGNELLDGEVDVTLNSVGSDVVDTAQESSSFTVKSNPDDGWHHHSFNTRRVPLDDPAFRQLLARLLDRQLVVDEVYGGDGAVKGSYATAKPYDQWRPPEPTEIDSYEGIPVPDLSFFGSAGTNQLDQSDIDRAREFLTTHDRAIHSYSVGDAVTDKSNAPDGKEIYVDGMPLSEAHTDNEGNAGQGPLEMSYNPADAAPQDAEIAQAWVANLRRVGVPVTETVESFSSQISKVYQNLNFDMFEMGWSVGRNNDHYAQLFGSEGIGPGGFNPMAYRGADHLIDDQQNLMDPQERQPIVKQILARIWADAPTLVTHHETVLQPVPTTWSGWVNGPGGVANEFSWASVTTTPAHVVRPSSEALTVSSSGTKTVPIVFTNATAGVGAFGEVTVSVGDTSVATLQGVTVNIGSDPATTVAADNSSVTASTFGADTADTGTITLLTVQLAGEAAGSTTLTVTMGGGVSKETGDLYSDVSTGSATVTVEAGPPAIPGFDSAPTNVDSDSQFEDVNGNGRFDIGDVQALFANRNAETIQNNVDAFDFNSNGRIDIGDIQSLFVEYLNR